VENFVKIKDRVNLGGMQVDLMVFGEENFQGVFEKKILSNM
jgi:hypothetical protein